MWYCGVMRCGVVSSARAESASLITQILPLSRTQIQRPLCHKYNSWSCLHMANITSPNTTSLPMAQISSLGITFVSPHKHGAAPHSAGPYCSPQCHRMRCVCLTSPHKHGNSSTDIASFIPNQFMSAGQTSLMSTSLHLKTTWRLQWPGVEQCTGE